MAIIVFKKKKEEDSNIPWIFIYKVIYIFKQRPQINDIMSKPKVLQLSLTPPLRPAPIVMAATACTDWKA